VNASSVGTPIHARSARGSRDWIASRRRRTILASAIFLDRMPDQRAGRGTNCRSDGCAPRTASSESADNRTRTCARCGTLTGWRIARAQTEASDQYPSYHRKNCFRHNDLFVRPLNRAIEKMFRSLWPHENFVYAFVKNQVAHVGLALPTIVNIARVRTLNV